MPILLLALDAPVTAAAAPRIAEEAMTAYRDTFKSPAELDCPRGQAPDDIVVCGRLNQVRSEPTAAAGRA